MKTPFPEKHRKVIKAWFDGAMIQYRVDSTDSWTDIISESPTWSLYNEYRVKPREAVVKYRIVYRNSSLFLSEDYYVDVNEFYQKNPTLDCSSAMIVPFDSIVQYEL